MTNNLLTLDFKVCYKCNETKSLNDFYEDGVKKGRKRNICKKCSSKEAAKKSNKRYKNDPNFRKKAQGWSLKRHYGITMDDYNMMFNDQDGKCKICEKHQSELTRTLFVDHCHETNIIRGLLCVNCNTIIGHAKDNIETLKKAIEYLEAIMQTPAYRELIGINSDE